MKIVQINTSDLQGGAARAAYRLHVCLSRLGHASTLLVLDKSASDDTTMAAGELLDGGTDEARRILQAARRAVTAGRAAKADTPFSVSPAGIDLSRLDVVRQADAIILHWVAEFQSPSSLAALMSLGKPVIWYLHDQWPLTGGCHYAGDCPGYLADCGACPQLVPELRPLAALALKEKKALIGPLPVGLASPSRWLAECAGRSTLFCDHPVRTIPNSLDLELFSPKRGARKRLGFGQEERIALFVAWRAEHRKGTYAIPDVLRLAAASPELAGAGDGIKAVCLGSDMPDISAPGVSCVRVGAIRDDAVLADYYRAADVFLIPSLEDNLPNTLAEAMACGVPVAGFRVGGMPDLIEHGVTGALAPAGDFEALAGALAGLLADRQAGKMMGRNARTRVGMLCSPDAQAEAVIEYIHELREQGNLSGRVARTEAGDCLEVGERQFLSAFAARALAVHKTFEAARRRRGAVIESAFALRDRGRHAEALATVSAALRERPGDENLLGALGALHASAGQTGEALECFSRLLRARPERLELLLNRSDALRYAGRFDEALEELDALERQAPYFAGLWLKRGQVFQAQGKVREAARAYIRECRRHGGPTARARLSCLR